MSKRARITLGPSMEPQSDAVAEAILAAEDQPQPARGPEVAAPSRPAAGASAEKTMSTGTIVKVVLMGLAVVAAVLLLKGRRP